MKIHEYQGKELLKQYGVPVPNSIVARTPEEAEQAAKDLGTAVVVVKAQIHAGGRGKGKFKELGLDAKGGAEDKIAAMEAAGIKVSPSPSELGTTLKALLNA